MSGDVLLSAVVVTIWLAALACAVFGTLTQYRRQFDAMHRWDWRLLACALGALIVSVIAGEWLWYLIASALAVVNVAAGYWLARLYSRPSPESTR